MIGRMMGYGGGKPFHVGGGGRQFLHVKDGGISLMMLGMVMGKGWQ